MDQHLEAVLARVSQFKATELPSALQALLGQAVVALKPPSKSDKANRTAVPAATKRSLVAAIVLLLERAGNLGELDGSGALQAVRTRLVASFREHAWLWERLIRKDLGELLGAPASAGLFAEALLQLSPAAQSKAFGLLWAQLAPLCHHQPRPSPTQAAALERILLHAFSALKRCFPVVSFCLPEEQMQPSAMQLEGPSQRAQRSEGSAQVQVALSEQLPALLHLALLLACGEQGGGGAQGSGGDGASSSAAAQSGSASNEGGSVAGPVPRQAATQLGSSQSGAAAGAAAAVPSTVQGSMHDGKGSAAAAGAAAREGVLRYAMLLLVRLGQPDSLFETLGLTLRSPEPGPRAAAADAAALASLAGQGGEGGPGQGSEAKANITPAEAARVRVAQRTMEVLLDALLTLPAAAAAACAQRQVPGSVVTSSAAEAAQQAQQAQQQQRRQQGQQGQRQREQSQRAQQAGQEGGEGGAFGTSPAKELGPTVAVLLALHWGLAKLQVACSAEPEGRRAKAHQQQQHHYLSGHACLQLVRLAASKDHLAGAATQRLLASMPRLVRDVAVSLPPVQLLLPPALLAHLLDLVGGALEGPATSTSSSDSSSGGGSSGGGGGLGQGLTPAPPGGAAVGAEGPEEAGSSSSGSGAGGLGWVGELAERVLEIQQACYQGLHQPWLLLHGPLHREAISAAARLHSLLTQHSPSGSGNSGGGGNATAAAAAPQQGPAAAQAAAAEAAAAACNMGAEGVAGGDPGPGTERRYRSAGRKRSLANLSESALAGTRQASAKRSRAQQGQQAGGSGRLGEGAGAAGAAGIAGTAGAGQGELAQPLAELLQLFQLELSPAPGTDAKGGSPALREVPLTQPAAPKQQQQQQQEPTAKKRIVPQSVELPAALDPTPMAAAAAPAAVGRKRITPMAMPAQAAEPPLPAAAGQPAASDHATPALPQPSSSAAAAAATGAKAGTSSSAGRTAAAAAAAAAACPAGEAGPAQQLQGQEQGQGGRIRLTNTAKLDDAGREQLWAAYIADKELLAEMLGDSNYQEWFDEAAHPLPLLEAPGSPLAEDDVMDDMLDDSPDDDLAHAPPGPTTLLAASLQLPWQAALAGCLLLLARCLDCIRGPGSGGGNNKGSHSRGSGGGTAGPAGLAAQQGDNQGQASAEVEAAVQLLCGVLDEKQRGAAALYLERHSGTRNAAAAKKGAISYPLGGSLLLLASQLLEACQRHTGSRTAPVLLSGYAALLSRLLALAQQEELQLRCSSQGAAKQLGTPPLELVPSVALQLLESTRLRPAALLADSAPALLRLSRPKEQQDALPQSAALLWGLLQPPGSLTRALAAPPSSAAPRQQQQQQQLALWHTASVPPSWLGNAPCELPCQLLLRRGAANEARAAAAEELLSSIEEGVRQWEEDGESGLAALARCLAPALPPAPPPATAAAEAGAAGSGSARGKSRRGKQRGHGQGRGQKAASAAAAAIASAAAEPAGLSVPAAGSAAPVGMPEADAAAEGCVEALLPAVDACCAAVQWVVRQQESTEGAEGAAPAGPLSSHAALSRLLSLSCRLAVACSSALELLAAYLDRPQGSNISSGGSGGSSSSSQGFPPALCQAAALWALSLEMGSCLQEGADLVPWPQALLPKAQQLGGALQRLEGVQQTCAELLRSLPDADPLYCAVTGAMECAPSLFVHSGGSSSLGQQGGGSGDEGGAGDAAGLLEGLGSDGEGDSQGGQGTGRQGRQRAQQQQQQQQEGEGVKEEGDGGRQRRRRLRSLRNPYLKAIIAEGGYQPGTDGDDLSDLEDFIVTNPEVDYNDLVADFHLPPESDGEEAEEGEEEEEEGEGEGVQEDTPGPLAAAAASVGLPAKGPKGAVQGGKQRSGGGKGRAIAAPQKHGAAGASKARGGKGGGGGSKRESGKAAQGSSPRLYHHQQQQEQRQEEGDTGEGGSGEGPEREELPPLTGATWARLQQLIPGLQQQQQQPGAAAGPDAAPQEQPPSLQQQQEQQPPVQQQQQAQRGRGRPRKQAQAPAQAGSQAPAAAAVPAGSDEMEGGVAGQGASVGAEEQPQSALPAASGRRGGSRRGSARRGRG